jgi:hypothetical protein
VESPEVHTPHSHHGGSLPRWLELSIAVTALITSVCSIVIAVQHGHIMEKLVQANSLPYVQGGFSDATPEGDHILSLDLLNRGVGPAHEKSLRIKVDDTYVTSMRELYAASLTPEQAKSAQGTVIPLWNRLKTRFIPGGQAQFVFRIRKTPENAELWEVLDKAQTRWSIEYCYCSVFNECWVVHGIWNEPQPIKACMRDEPHEFMP